MNQMKLFRILYYVFLLDMILTIRVQAYIDPSVTTYAIQALAGVMIGLSAFLNIYWHRIARRLNIGSSSYKDFESDDLYFNDPVKGIKDELHYPVHTDDVKTGIWSDVPAAVFIPAAFVYLLIVYGPSEIYVSNRNEFWFDYPIMIKAAVPLFFLLCALLTVILMNVRKYSRKAFTILCAAVFSITVILYIHGVFMSGHVPPMDGTTPVWNEYYTDMVISLFVTILVIAGAAVMYHKLKEAGLLLMTVISFLIAAALGIMNIMMVFTTNIMDQKLHYIISEAHYSELSPEKNFIIFLLDAVDSRAVQKQMAEEPEFYKETFADFMFYPDTSGTYSFTQEAVPYIMNGKWFENQENFHDFQLNAMQESPLFQRLEREEWLIDYYDHDLMYLTDYDTIGRYRNAYRYDAEFSSLKEYAGASLRLTLFKYAPYYLKPLIRFEPGEFLSLRKLPEGMLANDFDHGNIRFHEQMNSTGFTVSDDHMPVFKFYHLDGAHTPFDYDEDFSIIEPGMGSYKTDVTVSMKTAAEFVQELRNTDVYDQTAVIIMADHGYGFENTGLTERANPLLMVKGFHERHDFRISKAPVSFTDLQDLYTSLLDGNKEDEQFVWKEGDYRQRRYLGYHYNKEYEMREFILEGNASHQEDYKPTGIIYTRP